MQNDAYSFQFVMGQVGLRWTTFGNLSSICFKKKFGSRKIIPAQFGVISRLIVFLITPIAFFGVLYVAIAQLHISRPIFAIPFFFWWINLIDFSGTAFRWNWMAFEEFFFRVGIIEWHFQLSRYLQKKTFIELNKLLILSHSGMASPFIKKFGLGFITDKFQFFCLTLS